MGQPTVDRIDELNDYKARLKKSFARYEKFRKESINATFIPLYLITVAVVHGIWYAKGQLTWESSIGIFFFTFYPGCIGLIILDGILAKPLKFLLENTLFKKEKADYPGYIDQLRNLDLEISDLTHQLVQELKDERLEKERVYAKELDRFFEYIKRVDSVNQEDRAKASDLEDEFNSIKRYGCEIHHSSWYTSRIHIINKIVNPLLNILPTHLQRTTEPGTRKTAEPVKPISQGPSIETTTQTVKPKEPAPTTLVVPTSQPVKEQKEKDVPLIEDPVQIPEPTRQLEIRLPEEREIEDLLGDRIERTPKTRTISNKPKTLVKIDFSEKQERNESVGKAGELFILKKEVKRLMDIGRLDLANMVRHVSEIGDNFGYDIESFTDNGTKKYIEVKTTTEGHTSPFYLSDLELRTMKELPNYEIHRVYKFDLDLGIGDMFKIEGPKLIEKFYRLEPTSYRVSLK
ncbi:MAG: DUF3883 domain-containing protein [Pedobacter sp.]|nr:MAG: DUF3883 domain-containing protein [Pedobacter sp.]